MSTRSKTDILELATQVFGDQHAANEWLNIENLALDQKKPCDLLHDEFVILRVENLLRRIDYGVLS